MKCENMSWEILEVIKDYDDGTEEGKELVRDCLIYLKELNNFKDSKLDEQILDWFNENEYCIKCGCKLQKYVEEEVHDELETRDVEYITIWHCPICDKYYD